eukprot:Skav206213  [mRNA]  locus=scaffold1844:503071:503823:+ [translate_table: standard]
MGANCHASVVLNHPGSTIRRHDGSVHSAPVTDDKEFHSLRAMKDHLRPFDAVVFCGLFRHLRHGSCGTVQT